MGNRVRLCDSALDECNLVSVRRTCHHPTMNLRSRKDVIGGVSYDMTVGCKGQKASDIVGWAGQALRLDSCIRQPSEDKSSIVRVCISFIKS